MARRKTRPKLNPKKPAIPQAEQDQVDERKRLGHGHVLRKDRNGRDRIAVGFDGAGSTVETARGITRIGRACPLRAMFAKGFITRAMLAAGERFRSDYETAERAGYRAGSFQERVDGSSCAASIPPQIIDAQRHRAEICKAAGIMGEFVLVEVCGHYRTISELEKLGAGSRDYLSPRLKEALEVAAVHYGIISADKRTISPAAMNSGAFFP